MVTAFIANIDLTIFDKKVFAIINHLRKQHKRADLDKLYNELIKKQILKTQAKNTFATELMNLLFMARL